MTKIRVNLSRMRIEIVGVDWLGREKVRSWLNFTYMVRSEDSLSQFFRRNIAPPGFITAFMEGKVTQISFGIPVIRVPHFESLSCIVLSKIPTLECSEIQIEDVEIRTYLTSFNALFGIGRSKDGHFYYWAKDGIK